MASCSRAAEMYILLKTPAVTYKTINVFGKKLMSPNEINGCLNFRGEPSNGCSYQLPSGLNMAIKSVSPSCNGPAIWLLRYEPIPHNKMILDKFIDAELVKTLLILYETRKELPL